MMGKEGRLLLFRVGLGTLYLVSLAAILLLLAPGEPHSAQPLARRGGPLGRWLDVHIFFGLVGPALVILHSAFKVQGLVALSFWSMIAVAASGVLGRYLYLQIPRNLQGDALDLKAL